MSGIIKKRATNKAKTIILSVANNLSGMFFVGYLLKHVVEFFTDQAIRKALSQQVIVKFFEVFAGFRDAF
jgi:uncharacterized membrane protein YozB (DUF420 family)